MPCLFDQCLVLLHDPQQLGEFATGKAFTVSDSSLRIEPDFRFCISSLCVNVNGLTRIALV
ncbi:hypothetical protein IP70_21405 [alpha proteobacterium AAP38]|nr:hypothetical protein IP70_21405 [alpha proteobacterium AAP38]